jgi:hypothetical protein
VNLADNDPADPGASLVSAFDLGALGTLTSRRDTVGPTNKIDVYHFSLSKPGNVTISLGNLSADANLELVQDLNTNKTLDSSETLKISSEAGTSEDWISTGLLTAANYYIRVVGSSAAANYTLNAAFHPYLAGDYGYAVRGTSLGLVGLERADGTAGAITASKSTWLVIHGRFSGPHASNMERLASAVDKYNSTDQVLTLDWSSVTRKSDTATSGSISDFAGEDWIPAVADWVAKKLLSLGFSSSNLINEVGWSWGGVMTAVIAADMKAAGSATPFGVNRILALDPARNFPGGFDTDSINFAANSRFSRALFSNSNIPVIGSLGSGTNSATADESFRVDVGGGTAAHSNIVTIFSKMLEMNSAGSASAVAKLFSLGQLTTAVAKPWVLNQYDASGSRNKTGKFEGILDGTLNGGDWLPLKLRYVSTITSSEVSVLA